MMGWMNPPYVAKTAATPPSKRAKRHSDKREYLGVSLF